MYIKTAPMFVEFHFVYRYNPNFYSMGILPSLKSRLGNSPHYSITIRTVHPFIKTSSHFSAMAHVIGLLHYYPQVATCNSLPATGEKHQKQPLKFALNFHFARPTS